MIEIVRTILYFLIKSFICATPGLVKAIDGCYMFQIHFLGDRKIHRVFDINNQTFLVPVSQKTFTEDYNRND